MQRDIPSPQAGREYKKKTIGLIRSHNNGRMVPILHLSDALAESRKGLTREQRIDYLWKTINRCAKEG